jgi:Cu2+-exporting ATPase
VNYATRRARVRWDERETKLSVILEAIAAIGYRAHPYDAEKSEQLARKERKEALWRLFVAGFGMMQVMMYAVPVYLADEGTMTPDIELLMRWASLILTLPVVLYSSAPFFRSAWRDLSMRRVGMDVPVAIGVGAAFTASLWGTLAGHGEVYFDSVTMFVFFLLTGRFLESMARQKAARGVETLNKAMPVFASRLNQFPALDVERVVATDLAPGDLVLVRPGEVFPADGEVLQGHSAVDESLLTGESRPVSKEAGAAVVAGSSNVSSPLVVRVQGVGEGTRLAAIQRMMERAAAEKPRVAQMADRIAAWFVAVLLVLALATAGVWYLVDPHRMLSVFIAVLVVSCPCALSLATPAVLAVATGAMASRGLLVVRGHAIETLAQVDRVVFDKTGTLTEGRLKLVEVAALRDADTAGVLALAAALEQASEHPIARALAEAAATAELPGSTQHRSVTGQGVEALVAGRRVRLGRPSFAAELPGVPVPDPVEAWCLQGSTVVALADEQGWLALFRLDDTLREGAVEAVAELHRDGIETAVLSGDAPQAAQQMAGRAGIVAAEGGLSPEDKHRRVKAMQAQGLVVAMVGDGVNDAPVLAQAQVSIAMGQGADLARAQSDLVLLGNNPLGVARGVRLARMTQRIIRQNLAWAFLYNVLAIPLAMAGWVTPWMAGIGMSLSSLLVVLNALRIQSDK